MNKKGFTPLEKSVDFKRRLSPLEADGDIKPVSAHTIRKRSSLTGFTLLEILISVGILAISITSTLQILNFLLQLNESNNAAVIGMNAVQGMMDEIRNVNYEDIVANYNGMAFTLNELTALGVTHSGIVMAGELEAGYLTRVKIVVCWQQRTRIMGEDTNLNGVLDGGEDKNGNGELDSPCMLEAAVMYR